MQNSPTVSTIRVGKQVHSCGPNWYSVAFVRSFMAFHGPVRTCHWSKWHQRRFSLQLPCLWTSTKNSSFNKTSCNKPMPILIVRLQNQKNGHLRSWSTSLMRCSVFLMWSNKPKCLLPHPSNPPFLSAQETVLPTPSFKTDSRSPPLCKKTLLALPLEVT